MPKGEILSLKAGESSVTSKGPDCALGIFLLSCGALNAGLIAKHVSEGQFNTDVDSIIAGMAQAEVKMPGAAAAIARFKEATFNSIKSIVGQGGSIES
jgi:hypothetical protein